MTMVVVTLAAMLTTEARSEIHENQVIQPWNWWISQLVCLGTARK